MEEKIFNKCENPWDIFHAYKRTRSVHARFNMVGADACPKNSEKGDQPLQVFSDKTKLNIAVIANGEAVDANFSREDLGPFIAKSKFAINKALEYRYNTKTEDKNENEEENENKGNGEDLSKNPAFTFVIKQGNLKGKTPAQVALEEGGEDKLNSQYKWLKDNLDKYPNNKVQMNAIMEAARLLKEGKITKENTAIGKNANSFVVKATEPMVNPWKIIEGEYFPVREIGIVMIPNNDEDKIFEISIENYEAKAFGVDKNGDKVKLDGEGSHGNKLNAVKGTKRNSKKYAISLSIDEFSEFIFNIENAIRVFIDANAEKLLYEVIKSDDYNRNHRAVKKDKAS